MDRPEAARRGPDRRLCDDLARGLHAEPTVRLAWLFGSRARGAARRDSDIDIAVLVGDARAAGPGAVKDTMFRVIGALGRFVRSDLVDLLLLDRAPPLLRHRVVRDGFLLYACSDAERARFVRRTLRDYLDFEPRLRGQNRLRIRRLKEGRPRHDGRHRDLLAAAGRALDGYLRRLRSLGRAPESDYLADPGIHDLAARYLHLAMEATIDLANHWIADAGLRMPETNRDAFTCLEEAGEIDPELAGRLREWAGFRNVLVHDYLTIDHGIAYRAIRDDRGDLDAFRGWALGKLDAGES